MADYLSDDEKRMGRAAVLQTAKSKVKCPHCDKEMSVYAGVTPKNCPFCRKPLGADSNGSPAD